MLYDKAFICNALQKSQNGPSIASNGLSMQLEYVSEGAVKAVSVRVEVRPAPYESGIDA
jgi:hypothetical protein